MAECVKNDMRRMLISKHKLREKKKLIRYSFMVGARKILGTIPVGKSVCNTRCCP